MKNLTKIIVFVFISAFLFSSCHKEGQYLPKKKITRLEHSTTYSNALGELTTLNDIEDWTWNGKLLSKITYRNGNGDALATASFIYDKSKRVSQLHYESASGLTQDYLFLYDGKNLTQIDMIGNDDEESVYTFTRVDGNVVEITLNTDESKTFDEMVFNPLRFVLPLEVVDVITTSATKGGTSVYKLTWDGKNVISCEILSNGVLAETNTWKYDENVNPFKGLFGTESLYGFDDLYSANNVVEETFTVPLLNTTVTKNFTYEYDGKWPVKQMWITKGLTGSESHHLRTFYYE